MKYFFLFILALILSGVMTLGHVPRKVTAHEDGGIGRVVNITSQASTDSSAVEHKSIDMKISVPYFVLPIPDKKLDFMNPLAITVTIANNTSNTIRAAYDTLIPEIVDPNGQTMQLQRVKKPSLDTKNLCSLVEPGAAILFSGAELAWKNNKLQLSGDAGNGYKWYFDDIKPGTYQIRFTYYSPGGEVSCYDLETDTSRRVEGIGSGRGATSFIPIRIVKPISIDSNTVEIDSILFKIIMPERVLTIPQNKTDAIKPIKINLQITNKIASQLRFEQSNITLQIIGSDGKKLGWKGSGGGNFVAGYNCPLVLQGKTITFSLDTQLFWKENLLFLGEQDGFGGVRYFDELKPGKYQIRIGYYPPMTEGGCASGLLGNTWKGLGATPFVDFSLVEP